MSEGPLTVGQMQVLEALLKSKRQVIVDLIKSYRAVTGTRHDCALLDVADSASLNEMRRRAAILIDQHESTLAGIDAAFDRIREGRYGSSEKTGKPILFERLLVVPWAQSNADD